MLGTVLRLMAPTGVGSEMGRGAVMVYGFTLAAVLLAAAARAAVSLWIEEEAPFIFFILPVLAAAILWGRKPGLLATGAGAAVGLFFFVQPVGFWADNSPADYLRVALFLVEGFVVSWLAGTRAEALEEAKTAQLALRLEADNKDRFLAVLGHELRNPLAGLVSGIEFLRMGPDRRDATKDAQEMIQRQVAHIGRLVDDLRDLSKISRGEIHLQKSPVELQSVVYAAVEQLSRTLAARRHELVLENSPAAITVNGDRDRLIQVVGNLLGNAAKYMDPGGQIRVRTTVEDGEALLSVSDSGYGIPREKLEDVFQMFRRLDGPRDHGGLGIGLALCRQLVAMHGGSIEARSDGPGHGSEFVVRLPLLAASEIGKQLEQGGPAGYECREIHRAQQDVTVTRIAGVADRIPHADPHRHRLSSTSVSRAK